MGERYAKEGTYKGEQAILLQYDRFSAVMLPRIGGNLIAFRDEESKYAFLREPEDHEWAGFVESPMVHGIPVLVPPNRIDRGAFTWRGRNYQFPINEQATGNHLHGFVYNYPWRVESYGSEEGRSYVTVSLRFDEGHPNYVHFPHTFMLTNTYELTADGLSERFTVVNEGPDAMPFMLGFHTAVNAPFAPGSTADDVEVLLTIGDRWELGERMIPTGRTMPLEPGEQKMKDGGGAPYFAALDNHYTAEPQDGRNRMELTDRKAGVRLVYEVGPDYGQWMVWNNGNCRRFFCPEPQTIVVDAPNSKLPAEQTGLIPLEPGQEWSETTRMYVEKL